MKTVSIVGLGRFGQVLYKILQGDFRITLYDTDLQKLNEIKLKKGDKIASNEAEIYKSETIFYAVPIASFTKVIKAHQPYFTNQLLVDVLSVKQYPLTVFEKIIPQDRKSNVEIMLTHPMFGPDSVKSKGLTGQPLVIDKYRTSQKKYQYWKKYFTKKGLQVLEMTAQEHDKLAARSQGVTHFLGRLLKEFNMKPTSLDTLGAKKINEVMDQTCNDTWELFLNLQNYNLYTKQMRIDLGKAFDQLYNKLLPKRISDDFIIYGIQGGPASFNEEMANIYAKKNNIKKYKIKYLFTTKNVLRALHKGQIDYGIFAIQNSVGGLVEESIKAMAHFKFRIVKELSMPIRHFLMKKRAINYEKINRVMAHPQVLKQCQKTLKKGYSHLKQLVGEGDLIDTATAAKALVDGQMLETTAILGGKMISKTFNLEIIAENLQDDKENITSFLLVERL